MTAAAYDPILHKNTDLELNVALNMNLWNLTDVAFISNTNIQYAA